MLLEQLSRVFNEDFQAITSFWGEVLHRRPGRIKKEVFVFGKLGASGPDQIISAIGNTAVWKRQRPGVRWVYLALACVEWTDGWGKGMLFQL